MAQVLVVVQVAVVLGARPPESVAVPTLARIEAVSVQGALQAALRAGLVVGLWCHRMESRLQGWQQVAVSSLPHANVVFP